MTVGVLALHGDFAEHLQVLRGLGVETREVRSKRDLREISHLIIPGGESTVMSLLLEKTELDEEIRKQAMNNDLAIYGTCAGAILLVKNVTGKRAPKTLELMDITVERNAYGTQAQSFQSDVNIQGIDDPLPVSFIRAPRIVRVGSKVKILARHSEDPILVQSDRLLAGTFHPEMRGQTEVHELFLGM